jgi:prepilin-type N-terminal cleavage/methylation domain-containing protein
MSFDWRRAGATFAKEPGMAPFRPHRAQGGFTLVEVLVSLAILVTALVGVAQLMAVGLHANLAARSETYATLLAIQKMEELAAGAPLVPSPADSLSRDVAGFYDYLAHDGRSMTAVVAPASAGVYVRRWSICPSEQDPDRTIVIQVIAFLARTSEGARSPAPLPARRAHLVTIKRWSPA